MDEYKIVLPQITGPFGNKFIQPIELYEEPGWRIMLQAEYVYEIFVTSANTRFIVPRLESIVKIKTRPTLISGEVCSCADCTKVHGRSKKFKTETQLIASYGIIK